MLTYRDIYMILYKKETKEAPPTYSEMLTKLNRNGKIKDPITGRLRKRRKDELEQFVKEQVAAYNRQLSMNRPAKAPKPRPRPRTGV